MSKPVRAELIEYCCDDCGKGVFRVSNPIPTDTSPKQWEHRCTHCDQSAYFTTAYPILDYRQRQFMLADTQRFVEFD